MSAILRFVAKTDTFEIQRQKINEIATDLYNVQTSVGEGAFSMSDGSVQEPALFFTNASDVGIFRGNGKSLYIAADGASVASFDSSHLTALQDFRTLVSAVPTGADGITITNGGSEYSSGVFSSIPLIGGSGLGLRASLTVLAIEGDILDGGNGYIGGSYVSVPLVGGSGTGAVAEITVSPFTGSIQNGGRDGDIGGSNSQIFTNVSLTGGSGSGMRADITVTDTGADVSVTGVNIVNQGSGYQTGDVLTAISNTIGGVTGFQYVINGVGNISQIQILLSDGGYQVGEILTVNNSNLGGSGSGFQFEITGVGIVTDASVTDGGDGYLIGDQVSVNNVELSPSEIWYVRMWMTQLFEFSGTLPTTGFNVGDTLSYSGETRTIVKRFLNNQNEITSVAVRAGAEDGNTIQFSPGLSADDGNGNSAVVDSTIARLNYYFSLNQAGPYENIKNFTFQKNKRYIFNQANSSNVSHPIRFSTTPDGIHTLLSGQGAQADFGDPYEGDEVNYEYTSVDVSIIPNENTPTTLYYYCSNGFGNPANEHIDEGGFDDREGVITISGEATVSGSGLIITVGQVDTESNIVLNKDGTALLGSTNASSLTLTGDLSSGGSTSLFGNLSVGSNKFTVNSSSGNTFIAGSLTVSEDLVFLSDAALGSTLYVDSTNNRVSINIDPQTTQLTSELQIDGSLDVYSNVFLSSSSGNTVIGSDTVLNQTDRLQVDGNIYASNKILAGALSDVTNPSISFRSYERYGLSFNPAGSSISLTGGSGEILKAISEDISIYRDVKFVLNEIQNVDIESGEGYTYGSYSGVQPTGGTGIGLTGTAIIAFATPIGEILTISNISSGDLNRVEGTYIVSGTSSGDGENQLFEVVVDGSGSASVSILNGGINHLVGDTITISDDDLGSGAAADLTFDVNTITSDSGSGYDIGQYNNIILTGGSGTGAEASITIESGFVSKVVVTNPGSGYQVGDTLSFNYTSLVDNEGQPSQNAPSSPASFTITKLGALTSFTISSYGEGYVSGDILEVNVGVDTPTSQASITIGIINSTQKIIINNETGNIETQSISTVGNGILVDNKLSIDGNTISSTQNDDVIISPGSASKLLSISGTGGVKIPVGTSTNRPSAGTLGIIRYNSQTQQYEGSNGTDFISLGGVRDVDGNTYILAEEFVGANDNTLYFVTDATNNARLTTNELTLITANTIASRDTNNRVVWEAETTYLLGAEVYYNDNLYEITQAGTTDVIPPSHISGSVIDGTAELTYVSSIFGDLTFKANNINLNGNLVLSGLQVYSYNTNDLILESTLSTTQFAFGKQSEIPDVLLTLTSSGELRINKSSGTANPVNNLTILDKTLKYLELEDIRIETSILTLLKDTTDNGSVIVYNPSEYISAKVVVSADNVNTLDKHIVEYNVIDKGSNIIVNEYGNLDTGVEQFTAIFDLDPSGNIRINPSLSSDLTTGDLVNIVVSITKYRK